MVARGAGAAGPVLLACRQWDPLGLARRLPSLGVGAWRCAPLLPWRVQCPVCVCAALAAGSGGSGRYLVLCLSRFPLPAPRVPRCVWRAVPSGCPLPSLAGTPFHAVCAFRALGLVALLVVPACPFRVCALALPRRLLPPPLGGVACAPRVVPALGAGRAVPRGPCPSACPAPVPCSVWHAWGGGVRSRFPPTWLGAVGVAVGRPRGGCLLLLRGASGVRRSPSPDCPPTGRAVGVRDPRVVGAGVRVWGPFSVPSACTPCGRCAPRGGSVASVCRGAGWGGGGGACAVPPVCAAGGGPVGRGVALPRSVPLPSLGREQSGCQWRRAVHGVRGPPYHPRLCSPAFSGRDLCGVLARWRGLACSPRPPWEPAAGAGGAGRAPAPFPGGGGTIPPASGGGGRGPRGLRAGGGVGGGVAPRPPCSPSGWRPAVLNPGSPSVADALPSGGRVRSGSRCRPGMGGGEERPVDRSPGGPCRPEPPLCPPWVGCGHGWVMWGVAPILFRCAVAPARWCGLPPRPRPPREQVQPHPPPPASRSLLGGGGRPLGSGGAEGRSSGSLTWGGSGGGLEGPPPRPPAPSGVGLPSVAPVVPPRGILVPWGLPGGRGRRARSGRPPTAQCGGGGGGGGEPPRPGSRPRLPRAGL